MVARMILMRHGRTYSNARKHLDTRPPGAELTEIGRQQAFDAGSRLRNVTSDIGLAVCSIAMRAQQSLNLALLGYGAMPLDVPGVGKPNIPVEVISGIHEIFVGDDYDDMDSPEAHRQYNIAFEGWQSGDLSAGLPGGETAGEMLDRYVPALMGAYERANGKDLFVVTHGAAIRVLCIHALADPSITRPHIDNGSLTVIEPVGEFGQWRCPMWASND